MQNIVKSKVKASSYLRSLPFPQRWPTIQRAVTDTELKREGFHAGILKGDASHLLIPCLPEVGREEMKVKCKEFSEAILKVHGVEVASDEFALISKIVKILERWAAEDRQQLSATQRKYGVLPDENGDIELTEEEARLLFGEHMETLASLWYYGSTTPAIAASIIKEFDQHMRQNNAQHPTCQATTLAAFNGVLRAALSLKRAKDEGLTDVLQLAKVHPSLRIAPSNVDRMAECVLENEDHAMRYLKSIRQLEKDLPACLTVSTKVVRSLVSKYPTLLPSFAASVGHDWPFFIAKMHWTGFSIDAALSLAPLPTAVSSLQKYWRTMLPPSSLSGQDRFDRLLELTEGWVPSKTLAAATSGVFGMNLTFEQLRRLFPPTTQYENRSQFSETQQAVLRHLIESNNAIDLVRSGCLSTFEFLLRTEQVEVKDAVLTEFVDEVLQSPPSESLPEAVTLVLPVSQVLGQQIDPNGTPAEIRLGRMQIRDYLLNLCTSPFWRRLVEAGVDYNVFRGQSELCVRVVVRLVEKENTQEALPEEEDDEEPSLAHIAPEYLYEDAHLAVVNKPAGMSTTPSATQNGARIEGKDLQSWFMNNERSKGFDPSTLWRCGRLSRLDSQTSGALMFGRRQYVAAAIVGQSSLEVAHKTYDALCLITANLDDFPLVGRYTADTGSWTDYSVVSFFREPKIAHIRCTIKAGEKHQIRRHLAAIGAPILQDSRYGSSMVVGTLLDRIALHCSEVRILHPHNERSMSVVSELPEDFMHALAILRRYEVALRPTPQEEDVAADA